MAYCNYCAQEEKLDAFGYCIKYSCFEKSDQNKVLKNLEKRAFNLTYIDRNETRQISGPVSNFYRVRNREANNIMDDATRIFGFVPPSVLSKINSEDQKQWDKHIRW